LNLGFERTFSHIHIPRENFFPAFCDVTSLPELRLESQRAILKKQEQVEAWSTKVFHT